MPIDKDTIVKIRRQTGAGLTMVQEALKEANGDEVAAIDILRKQGALKAAKKSDRDASEGLIDAYIHAGGKVGVLLHLSCP